MKIVPFDLSESFTTNLKKTPQCSSSSSTWRWTDLTVRVNYCSYPSWPLALAPPSPPPPNHLPPQPPSIPIRRALDSRKSNSGVLAPINHSSNPLPLPAEHRGRNIIPFPLTPTDLHTSTSWGSTRPPPTPPCCF